jgi:exodeoxyribonuclease VIII
MKTPTLGAHPDTPFEEYLAWDAVGSHDLMLMRRSPAHYREAKLHPSPPTTAMRLGTAAHAWILTADRAADEVVVAPKVDRRTKAGKEAWAEFEARSGGRTIVSEDEADTLSKMAAAVSHSPAAQRVLSAAGMRECSYAWQDPDTGIICRGRPDAKCANMVVDLKTCADASPGEFAKSVFKYNYHMQGAFYLDGLSDNGHIDKDALFVIVAVEKTAPYGVGVYVIDDDGINAGRIAYRRALQTYKDCVARNEWPGYEAATTIKPIETPRWVKETLYA